MRKPSISLRPNVALFLDYTKSPQSQRSYTNSTIQKHTNTRDPIFLATVLKLSSNTRNSLLGSHIHAHVFKLGLSNDIFSMNNLLWMYSKCQLLDTALGVFAEMGERRNLVSWTSMVSGSVQNGEHGLGVELYLEMMRYGYCPNQFALASVLTACTALGVSRFGCSVHSFALKVGLDKNSFVGSSLICLYAKNGNVEAAEIAFGCIENRDLACWNAMAECYASNGYGYDAMTIVVLIHRKGVLADQFTFLSAIKGCLITNCIDFGRQIHSLVIHSGIQYSNQVMNSLLDMYFAMDMKDFAMKVFSKIRVKDCISWNTVINGFAREGDMREVMCLFTQMLQSNISPNQITFSILFRLCGATDNLLLGLQFCSLAYHLGYFHDTAVVANSLVNMFSKSGMMNLAHSLFSCLHNRNIITWNEMISGYNLNGFSTQALQLFSELINTDIKADEVTYLSVLGACQGIELLNVGEQIHSTIIKSGFHSYSYMQCSLISVYKRFGLVSNCHKIFQDVQTLDMVTWGAMISALSKNGCSNEAFSLLNSYRESGENPDEFILGSSLNACANNSMLTQLRGLHSLVVKSGCENHLCVASGIIDAYAKCGDISCSQKAFDTAPKDSDAVIFNTMITAYAHHGLIAEAIQLFKRMKQANLNPTHPTFVAIISACSHLGLVEQGRFFFDLISCEHGMHPSKDNFACLVDMYARNGLLQKAKEVIESMPYEPWPSIWRCLLSGCRIYGDKEMGEVAGCKLLALLPSSDSGYVLFSNVYAGGGRWEDAEKVRTRMEEEGIRKKPGYSTTEL